MCGLVGIVTKNSHGFTKEQVDAFDNLLFIDALRGMDSTGVFVVDKDGTMDLAKEATPSYEFRQDPAYRELCKTAFQRGRAMIGHNRAATKGSVIDANAHPFVVDDRITLCHNGTLWGDWSKLADAKVDVDSHAIAHKIHECGDDVEKALQQINGAYALIWHDFKHNTLNFVRNSQRPLNYVETSNGWLWASEANMLEWILARYKFKQEAEVAELPAGCLVTYDFSNNSWKLDHKEIKLEAPKPAYTPQVGWVGGHGYRREAFAYGQDFDDGMDGWNAFGRPTCDKQEIQPAKVEERVERAKYTGRTISEENALGAKYKMDITSLEFANNADKVGVTDTWVKGTCIDSTTVKPNDNSFGHFLYAIMDDNPNYLVKVFLPASTNEMDLLDWCLNGQVAEFHIASRQWRTYHDASQGQGLAILNCDLLRETAEAANKTLEALI